MPFAIVRQDLTKMRVDAIVNAANTALAMGGGVCGAIFRAAGARQLQAACDALAPIPTGGAAITPGFGLPCKYIIHAAGPIYRADRADLCQQQLRSAYTESLRLAAAHGCGSIAFPLISAGIYGYPKAQALQVASDAIRDFLAGTDGDMQVYLTVFEKEAFAASQALMGAVASYIDETYVTRHQILRGDQNRAAAPPPTAPLPEDAALSLMAPSAPAAPIPTGLQDLMHRLDEPFSAALLRLIDAKGQTDVQVYKRANLDRKLFSKIRTGKGYTPSKRTILALAVALELDLAETDKLLERAGYALSHSQKFDVIVEYFILNHRYDIYEINEVLFQYDQPLLGG